MTPRLRVLNSRPQPKAASLTQLLEAQNIEVVEYSPILIEALPGLAHDQQAKEIAYNLDRFSDIIITSGFAAEFGLDFLANYWPQWPEARWWSIGSATRQCMSAFSINALAPPESATQNSESLLQALILEWNNENTERSSLADTSTRNILIIAGKEGRGHLQAELKKNGIYFSVLEVYQRTLNPQPLPRNTYDAIVLTSVDIAKGILENDQVLTEFGPDCHFICASERIANFVRSKGGSKVVNSRSANNKTVSEHILQLLL